MNYNSLFHINLFHKEGCVIKAFNEFSFILKRPPYYSCYLQEGRSSYLTYIHTIKRIIRFSCSHLFDSIVGRKSMMEEYLTSKTYNSILLTKKEEVERVKQNRVDLVLIPNLYFTLKERSTKLNSEPSRSFQDITKIRHSCFITSICIGAIIISKNTPKSTRMFINLHVVDCFSNFINHRNTTCIN